MQCSEAPSHVFPLWTLMLLLRWISPLLLLFYSLLTQGHRVAGKCEIVALDRDRSQPQRTVARQTARCACRRGQIAGTSRAQPACVDVLIIQSKRWCDMTPCLKDEGCHLLVNYSGWTCKHPGGRVKTTMVT